MCWEREIRVNFRVQYLTPFYLFIEQPLALISPLNRAMIQAHQQGRRTSDGGGPNVCAECGKGFKSKNALLDHEHVHKGATTCPFCGRICSTKGNLKQHLVKHLTYDYSAGGYLSYI